MVVALILSSPAAAATRPCPVDPSVSSAAGVGEVDPAVRSAFISERIEVGARRARAWAVGWGVTYGAAAIGQLVATPFVDRGTRIDLYVGATSAGIGVLTRSIMIPGVLRERRRLRRQSFDDPCARAQAHERAMTSAARSERRGHAWWLHGAALAYNAAIGLVLGLGFDRPRSGNRQAVIGAAVGQIMIVTQPTPMLDALQRYRFGTLSDAKISWSSRPLVLPGGGGATVVGRF
jgi:hypothetical protein